jgi:hypothetical protein
VVAGALVALSAIAYGPHAIHGGFVADAWSLRAIYEFWPDSGLVGGIGALLDQPHVRPRPLYAVYGSLQNTAFGDHMGFWLAWQGAQAVLMASALYLLLRELRLSLLDAGAIAALALIFPASSSLRLWAVPISDLAIAIALVGFVVGLRAFREEGRRRFALHAVSVALFAISVAFYEIALVPMLASVLVYRVRVEWRVAARRWLADCAVLVPLVTLLKSSSDEAFPRQDLAGMWRHVELIWSESHDLFTSVVLPLDTGAWQAGALVALVPVAAAVVRHRLAQGDVARYDLTRWLATLVGGVAVVAAGYAIFVPAIDFYAPMSPGLGNRVNALAGIGWVLVVYSLVMLAATLAFRGLELRRPLTAGVAIAVCLIVGGSWLGAVRDEGRDYERAYEEGQRVVSAITAAVSDPRPGSTVWAFGQPAEMAPGIPIFGDTWDLRHRVKLAYGDPSLAGYVAFDGTTFDCRRRRVVPGGHPKYLVEDPWWVEGFDSPYGRTYFVDTTSGRAVAVDSRRTCRQAARSLPRSPQLPPAAAS